LSARTGAAHVLVTYPMFRFFERGAHALSLWPFEQVRAGDVFAGHEYHTPPGDPLWILLSRAPGTRVWLRVSELHSVQPRIVAANGTSRILYDVRSQDVADGGFVVWQATTDAPAVEGKAVFEAAADAGIDPALVSTACDPPARNRAGLRCSGIVGVRDDGDGKPADDRLVGLAVGLETAANPADVRLTVARVHPAPGVPPQSTASAPATTGSARR